MWLLSDLKVIIESLGEKASLDNIVKYYVLYYKIIDVKFVSEALADFLDKNSDYFTYDNERAIWMAFGEFVDVDNKTCFLRFLDKKVQAGEIKDSSKTSYISSMTTATKWLKEYGLIDDNVFEINSPETLAVIYDLLKDESTELYRMDKRNNRRVSCGIKLYKEALQEKNK